MKNKFIVLTLCFTIIFTNINLTNNKSYANNINPIVVDGGIISAPMLATVSALAVGTGIIIKNNDDIYDIGKMFYNYISNHNSLTWDFVNSVFVAGHTLINNYVHVDSNFLDIIKGFFDTNFTSSDDNYGAIISYKGSIPILDTFSSTPYSGAYILPFSPDTKSYIGDLIYQTGADEYSPCYVAVFGGSYKLTNSSCSVWGVKNGTKISYYTNVNKTSSLIGSVSLDLDYILDYGGSYDWDKVENKKEEDKSIALPIPGNLGQLVGQGSDEFWDNTDGLVGGGSITLPGISNPSIDVTDDVFIGNPSVDVPGTDSPAIPNDSIWSTIKDFVVSLVVPSDTFWTDTFNGFRDNFSKNFPMLDMSKFDSLAVGGKPFPNLYAYGSKIVDGDVINSIVDWLRPIVAGFIMICLMFFNYRKIYKLIRNTEPFGGIAQGSSDFRTGLSAPPINNGLDSNPMGNLRDTLFDMRNEILRRENSK